MLKKTILINFQTFLTPNKYKMKNEINKKKVCWKN